MRIRTHMGRKYEARLYIPLLSSESPRQKVLRKDRRSHFKGFRVAQTGNKIGKNGGYKQSDSIKRVRGASATDFSRGRSNLPAGIEPHMDIYSHAIYSLRLFQKSIRRRLPERVIRNMMHLGYSRLLAGFACAVGYYPIIRLYVIIFREVF